MDYGASTDPKGHIICWIETVAFPFLLKPEDDYYVQEQQALLGGILLRQLRLPHVECDYEGFTEHTCYDNNAFFEGTVDFGAVSYTFQDADALVDQTWGGKYGSYPGGGFTETLALDYDSALQRMAFLRNISWLDGGTRFLALDFNTFNPSSGLHTVARLAWEMPAGG